MRFVPLPPPTTAEVEELTRTVADRLTARLAAASEEENDYLDPDLAALIEALFWSRNPPRGKGSRSVLSRPALSHRWRKVGGTGETAADFASRERGFVSLTTHRRLGKAPAT